MNGLQPRNMKQINVRVSEEFHKRLKQACVDKDISMKDFVVVALELGLRSSHKSQARDVGRRLEPRS
jgi:predicted HicB family RNase H-like nuclease